MHTAIDIAIGFVLYFGILWGLRIYRLNKRLK